MTVAENAPNSFLQKNQGLPQSLYLCGFAGGRAAEDGTPVFKASCRFETPGPSDLTRRLSDFGNIPDYPTKDSWNSDRNFSREPGFLKKISSQTENDKNKHGAPQTLCLCGSEGGTETAAALALLRNLQKNEKKSEKLLTFVNPVILFTSLAATRLQGKMFSLAPAEAIRRRFAKTFGSGEIEASIKFQKKF